MKCPHCGTIGAENVLRMPAWHNVEAYREALTVATLCCSKPLVIQRQISIGILATTTTETVDDWGNFFNNH